MKHHDTFIFDADEHSFHKAVLERSKLQPVLADFWAGWCPPCRALTPVLEKLVHHLGGTVLLAKVEADDNMRLAGHYRLRGFPTVILFHGGHEMGRFSGFKTEHFVREFLEQHLPGYHEQQACGQPRP